MGLLELQETKGYFLFNTFFIVPMTVVLLIQNPWWFLGLVFQGVWTLNILSKHWKD